MSRFEAEVQRLAWIAQCIAVQPRPIADTMLPVKSRRRPLGAREHEMIALHTNGATLQAIGEKFRLSRERVRQILRKHGYNKETGGRSTRTFLECDERVAKKRAAENKREAKCFSKWGITREQYNAISSEYGNTRKKTSPLHKYAQQRKNAAKRGIVWDLTFCSWWRIWQDSGQWKKRGRGQGFCMARHGDNGPYSESNVYICTIGQNFSDSWLVAHPRRKKGRGFSVIKYSVLSGERFMVRLTRPVNGKTNYGAIPSHEAALQLGQQLAAQQ